MQAACRHGVPTPQRRLGARVAWPAYINRRAQVGACKGRGGCREREHTAHCFKPVQGAVACGVRSTRLQGKANAAQPPGGGQGRATGKPGARCRWSFMCGLSECATHGHACAHTFGHDLWRHVRQRAQRARDGEARPSQRVRARQQAHAAKVAELAAPAARVARQGPTAGKAAVARTQAVWQGWGWGWGVGGSRI